MDTTKVKQITSADAGTNVLVRAKSGVLADLNILVTSAHTIGVYDTADSTTPAAADLLFTIPASAVAGYYKLNIALRKGLVLVVAASFAANHLFTHRAG